MSQIQKSPAPPKILYKLRGTKNFDRDLQCLLVERKLWCASPMSLNDPFDCYPRVVLPSAKEAPAVIDRAVRSYPPENQGVVRERCELLMRSRFHQDAWLREFITEDLARLGVLSLSALEGVPAIQVKYDKDRPPLSPFGEVEDWMQILFTKFKAWSYEKEWRYIRQFDEGGTGFLDVPEKAIREVCLGPRMCDKDRERVIEAAQGLPDKPRILLGRRERDRYGLRFDEIRT